MLRRWGGGFKAATILGIAFALRMDSAPLRTRVDGLTVSLGLVTRKDGPHAGQDERGAAPETGNEL